MSECVSEVTALAKGEASTEHVTFAGRDFSTSFSRVAEGGASERRAGATVWRDRRP